MKFKISLLFLSISLFGFSQNYQPFPNSADTFSFSNSEGLVRFITFDSVTVSANSDIYHLHKEISFEQNSPDSCQGHLYDTAWAGYDIEVSNNQITFRHSEYLIYVDMTSNSSTPVPAGFLNFYSSLYSLTATLQQTSYRQIFNGTMDTVKTFQLIGIDSLGQILNGTGSYAVIEISKNNGLLAIPYFFSPYNQYYDFQYRRTDYKLLSRGAIFDFEVGDIYQYVNRSWAISSPWQFKNPTHEEYEIFSKTQVTSDSLHYLMKKTYSRYRHNSTTNQLELKVYHDTVGLGVGNIFQPISSNLTNEADSSKPLLHNFWLEDTLWSRNGIVFLDYFFEIHNNCIHRPFEPANQLTYYNKGLGLTYQEGMSYAAMSFSIYELIYFHKVNGPSGGTKVNIGLEEFKNQKISFYPNPATDVFYFDFIEEKNQLVEIFTLEGRLVISQTLSKENNMLDVGFLPSGIYLIYLGGNSAKLLKI